MATAKRNSKTSNHSAAAQARRHAGVINMVDYVASPLATATTGAALRVDGGVVDTIA